MSIDFLTNAMIPVIVGICLCLGFLIKSNEKVPNKWIPTILAVVGVAVALWINGWRATPDVLLSGLVSGLGACGLYDTYKHFFVEGKVGKTYDDDEYLTDEGGEDNEAAVNKE